MKVLVNALSVTNQSGRHVLMGHLLQLRQWTLGKHEFVILFHESNRDMVVGLDGFRWLECPAVTAGWVARAKWEYRNLNRIAAENECDFMFTPAGVTVPGIRIPQVVFCQNPWCLVPILHKSLKDRFKAAVQRRAYKRTMRDASLMVFNSQYMNHAYRENAGFDAVDSMVVYQAIANETWDAGDRLGKSMMEPNHVVSVSAMAPHKGADDLVRALSLVRSQGVDARLTFAGGWPDKSHRSHVESLVDQLGIREHVTFCGWITDQELHELYSRAHVFALLSKCESFGIPAVEAQSFGTPTLGTNTCAIPEVGGDGGLYCDVQNPETAAHQLRKLLTNSDLHNELSQKARQNAQRFRWSECSRPLLEMFERVEAR